jgi:hypothetical protein
MASKYLKRTTAKERQNNITNSNKTEEFLIVVFQVPLIIYLVIL